MNTYRHTRALAVFITILFLVLIGEALFLSYQLQTFLIDDLRKESAMHLDIMADSAYEAVLKSDYVTIRTFIERWSSTHPDIIELRAVSPNGFIIAEALHPPATPVQTFSLTRDVSRDGRNLLRLELVSDVRSAVEIVASIRNRMLAGAVLLTIILGTVIWRSLQALAIGPLQHEISLRAGAEKELQRANEALDSRVQERTADLRRQLAERSRIEAELVRREEHIRLLLDSTAEGIYGVDTAGTCTFCNPSCLRILGFEREDDLLGRNIHARIHHRRPDGSDYPEHDCRIYNAYRLGTGCHVDDEVFWRSDGTPVPVEYWSFPVTDRSGTTTGAVVTFIDISDRKRLEAQLVQSQKMEAIGTLAGGVAHDFNNILTAIMGYGGILQKKMAESDPLRSHVAHILDAANRAARLTRSLLAFSRKQIIDPKPVDLNAVIRRVEKLLARLIGEDIDISMELCDTDLIVLADGGQLEQVIMNLAANARDAMPQGGSLIIGTKLAYFEPLEARMHGLSGAGDYAVLSLSDSGIGMDEKTQNSIFEPFFTTKEVGRGTGLGLSIAYGIIKQHNGVISVYSELGKGTTFRIYLPVLHAQVSNEPTPHGEEAAGGGSETILVAEDDRSLLELLRTILTENGYRMVEASDGEEAVHKFRENQDRIHLVILDTIMPKMNGRQAYEAIRKIRPDTRVLFMSGYTADIIGKQGLLEVGFDLMQKPISPSDLLVRVRRALTE